MSSCAVRPGACLRSQFTPSCISCTFQIRKNFPTSTLRSRLFPFPQSAGDVLARGQVGVGADTNIYVGQRGKVRDGRLAGRLTETPPPWAQIMLRFAPKIHFIHSQRGTARCRLISSH